MERATALVDYTSLPESEKEFIKQLTSFFEYQGFNFKDNETQLISKREKINWKMISSYAESLDKNFLKERILGNKRKLRTLK